MNLEQINLCYQQNEDRILLRIGFGVEDSSEKKQEILIFITRRLLQNLWPVMLQAMATQITLERPQAAFASTDLVQMEFEQAVSSITQSGNFAQAYENKDREWPLGQLPLLLDGISFHIHAGHPVAMQLKPLNGSQIELRLPPTVLHGFCKLLQEAEKQADWGLTLQMPGSEQHAAPSRLLN